MIHHETAFHPLHVHCVRSHTRGQDLFYSRSGATSSHTSRHLNGKDNCIAVFEIMGSFFICHYVLKYRAVCSNERDMATAEVAFRDMASSELAFKMSQM
ncbi:unnamed protein product [Sphagnum balticum]